MTDEVFPLARSSFDVIKQIIWGYSHLSYLGENARNPTLATLLDIEEGVISTNTRFLEALGLVGQKGYSRWITPRCRRLGIAIQEKDTPEYERCLREIVYDCKFLRDLIPIVGTRTKSISRDDLASIIYDRAPGKWSHHRAGARACVDLLVDARILELRGDQLILAPPVDEVTYVDRARIEQLRAIDSQQYDLARLIQLCDELNICWAHQCYHAVAMLVRAITDQVPPLFGFKKFAQVSSNYGGSTSFRESMSILSGSLRKIANAHLHTHIRRKEVLPTRTQVDFSSDLDVLLGEIVRLLK